MVIGLGGMSFVAGLLLLQVNFLLPELARFTGINFVVNGEPVNYTAPVFLYVVPVLLLVAGGIALGGGVNAILKDTAPAPR
ncbi:hypothetical protein XI38_08000 [Microbacterium aurantiacum]|uniref:Uncharacterized protein n=2 Tax=Microbacterium aurantiacum TaxID=162393 RepID=A0A0M8MG19_9MICO|nr:hypothetical protein XI38_08000 [Microbacterium chocolatum]